MKNSKLKLAVVAALLIPTMAIANGYGHNRGHNRGYHNHGYYHNHGHNRGYNNNWVAPAIGAVILGGVIGAALSQPQAPVYVQPPPGYRYEYRYENVYVPSCNCYQTVLVPN
jgi:hypothetical protein